MFERLKFAKKVWKANQAASRVTPLIVTFLFRVRRRGGGFDPRLKSDTFVVGYIYGVTMAFKGAGNPEEKGYFSQQVFEQLFPEQGKTITEYCSAQALQKNPDFVRATRVGLEEMTELGNSEGENRSTAY